MRKDSIISNCRILYSVRHRVIWTTIQFLLFVCAFFLVDSLLNIIFFLAEQHGMWDLNSPTRDRTHAPCSASTESYPLDRQGSPPKIIFNLNCLLIRRWMKKFIRTDEWRMASLDISTGVFEEVWRYIQSHIMSLWVTDWQSSVLKSYRLRTLLNPAVKLGIGHCVGSTAFEQNALWFSDFVISFMLDTWPHTLVSWKDLILLA